MPTLDDKLYQQILRLSQRADHQLNNGACKGAVRLYLEALEMLPKPIEQLEAATWLSGNAANALFFDRQYAAAVKELRRTLQFPGAEDNPFIHLRLGQALYEINEMEEARQELLKAYMLDGETVFEDEDTKYLKSIRHLTASVQKKDVIIEDVHPDQLDDELHRQITELYQQGDVYAERQQYEQALTRYYAALQLLPEPIERWEASTWILGAIGDTAFFADDYHQAKQAIKRCMHCPDAIGNAFLHLRLGQAEFELGNLEHAADELARAYMGGGPEIFDSEDQKYIDFIRKRLKDV